MPDRVRPADEPKSNGPSVEDFLRHLARDLEIGSQIARMNAARGTNLAQWENLGGDSDEIREGRKLDRDGMARLNLINRVAGYMGMIEVEASGQANFAKALDPNAPKPKAPGLTAEALELARADTDGWNTGWAGGSQGDNPHEPGTEIHVGWARACTDGADARQQRDAAKGKAPAVAAEKRKPGRPVGSGKKADAKTADAKTAEVKAEAPKPAAPTRTRRKAPEAAATEEKPGWDGERDFSGPEPTVDAPSTVQ